VVAPVLESMGYKLERAKTNMGLGRITNSAENKEPEEQPSEILSEIR
jgi:hypothetical protein